MDLVAHRSNTIKHLVRQSTDKVLSGVHAHVGVPRFPINGSSDFITNGQLMSFLNGVVDISTPPNFRYLNLSVWT